jgi:uncharacterized damage-inducible protein DinB
MSNPKLEASEAIPRPDPDMMGDEWDSLSQWLDFHRATFRLKCAGLTDEQLKQRPISTTNLSLLGLMRHLTEVERGWFAETLAGRSITGLYYSEDDPDGDFDQLDSRPVSEVQESYLTAIREAHDIVASFEDADDLRRHPTERPVRVRWVMMHMLEEYARHNGHADLIREAIDGARGE